MSITYQIDGLEEIVVSAISITKSEDNFERADFQKDKDLKSLSENIKQNGLIQPIMIAELEESTLEKKLYEVIAGNRRFAAWKIAFPEKETIKCLVLPKDTSEIMKSILSFSENISRLNLDPEDKGIFVKRLLPHYENSRLKLAKALGYETATQINAWLGVLELNKELVNRSTGPIGLKVRRAKIVSKLPQHLQIPAMDALNKKGSGDYDTRKFVNHLNYHQDKTPEEVMDELDKQPKTISLMVTLDEPVNLALEKGMKESGLIKTRLAERIIEDYLKQKGYLAVDYIPIKEQK